MSKQEPLKVCVLGSEGSGKTCFLAGMAILSEANRPDPIQVLGTYKETQKYLNDLAEIIRNQEWPPATTSTTVLQLDLLFKKDVLNLVIIDFPGEDFRTALNDLDFEHIKTLKDHMFHADAILFLFDPNLDLKLKHDLTSCENQNLQERQSAFLNSFIEYYRSQIDNSQKKRIKLPNIAILLTKSDLYPDLHEGKISPEKFFKKIAPNFFIKIKSWSSSLAFFAISSVGRVENGTGGQIFKPVLQLSPSGYSKLFAWIMRVREKTLSKNKIVATFIIITIVAVLMSTGVYYWYYQNEKLKALIKDLSTPLDVAISEGSKVLFPTQELKKEIDTKIEKKVRSLEKELAETRTVSGIRAILKETKSLLAIKYTTLSIQLKELKKNVTDKLDNAIFKQVSNANDSNHKQRFNKLANDYIQEFPEGKNNKKIQDMLLENKNSVYKKQRYKVLEVKCTDSNSFGRKAKAIRDFLLKYPDEQEKKTLDRAARLAQMLSEKRKYNVGLINSGRFKKKRNFKIVVSINDKIIKEFKSTAKVKQTNWKNTNFQITWKPNDKIPIELVDLDFVDEKVADIQEKNPLSIRVFNHKQAFTKIEKDWEQKIDGKPYVKFQVEGLSKDDWKILNDWVYTGDMWGQN